MAVLENEVKIDSILKLHYYLADVYQGSQIPPLHMFVTFSRTTIENLPYAASKQERWIDVEPVAKDVYNIKIRVRKRGASGWLITKDDVWLFYIRSQESSEAGTVAETWISGMNPFISQARIPPNDLFDLLDALNEIADDGIIIDAHLARSRRDRLFGRDKDWASQKGWPVEKYDRRKLQNRIAATESILFAVKVSFPSVTASFLANISRYGHITFYKAGEQGFSNFYNHVVDAYINRAVRYRDTLTNKEVKIKPKENVINPIIFNPKKSLGIPDFDEMIAAFLAEPDYMISIKHKGNPWLYLTVIDRSDGSTCEIYGFEDELQLIPQFRATSDGLSRLENLIYEVFPNIIKQQE